MNSLTDRQVEQKAHEAMDIMMSVPYDSFGPTDACRMLEGFWDLPEADRSRIVLKTRELCG